MMPLGIRCKAVFTPLMTLEAHNTSGGFGQPVNQFALAFVTPLSAHHHHVAPGGHGAAAVRHLLISV
jgi:hypothetical protein